MDTQITPVGQHVPWNKGKLVGQKPPLRINEIWAIRVRLQVNHRIRELALFNLAIDSKLRPPRPCSTSYPGRVPWRTRRVASNRDAAEDATTRAVRNHRSDPRERF